MRDSRFAIARWLDESAEVLADCSVGPDAVRYLPEPRKVDHSAKPQPVFTAQFHEAMQELRQFETERLNNRRAVELAEGIEGWTWETFWRVGWQVNRDLNVGQEAYLETRLREVEPDHWLLPECRRALPLTACVVVNPMVAE